MTKPRAVIVAVAGHPGAGKSTLAGMIREESAAVGVEVSELDKDAFLGEAMETAHRLMGVPHGFGTRLHAEYIAPWVYEAMRSTILGCAEAGRSLVVTAHWARDHFGTDHWLSLAEDISGRGAGLVRAWVDTDPVILRGRVLARGAERDAEKIHDWDGFAPYLEQVEGRALADVVVDNSGDREELLLQARRLVSNVEVMSRSAGDVH